MKRLICVVLLVVMLLSILAACGGSKFTCALCGKEKSGKKHTEELYGEKVTYCNDCYKGLNELNDYLGSLS